MYKILMSVLFILVILCSCSAEKTSKLYPKKNISHKVSDVKVGVSNKVGITISE